jgi:hypothetical protein
MGDYSPVFTAGKKPRTYTVGATAAVGGQLAELTTAETVIPSTGATSDVVGVFAHDAAIGALVTVWPLAGVTHEITASAAVAVGDNLAPAAAGKAAPIGAGTFGQLVGVATTVAAGDGVKFQMVGR